MLRKTLVSRILPDSKCELKNSSIIVYIQIGHYGFAFYSAGSKMVPYGRLTQWLLWSDREGVIHWSARLSRFNLKTFGVGDGCYRINPIWFSVDRRSAATKDANIFQKLRRKVDELESEAENCFGNPVVGGWS